MERAVVAKHIGTTTESLRRWVKAATAAGTMPTGIAGETTAVIPTTSAPTVTPAPSSAPRDPGAGLGEHETKAILDYKKRHPSMGPAQIRAQLKRFLGWRVSVRAIARVLRQAGFPPVHRKGRPVGDEHPTRWEAPHRNELWMQSDAFGSWCAQADTENGGSGHGDQRKRVCHVIYVAATPPGFMSS